MTNNPNEYYSDENGEQYIDFIHRVFGDERTFIWCIITAGKYVRRAGKKMGNGIEQDIKKIKDYLKYASDCDYARTDEGRVIITNMYCEYFSLMGGGENDVRTDTDL